MWRRSFGTGSHAVDALKEKKWDALVIGGGHNGLTAAAYLARGGLSVAVLERRHVIGGAAVTEELIPGFKFSRCSYLQSLLRPSVISELELARHGLKLLKRNPSSFTPCLDGRYLLLGPTKVLNHREISKFSKRDADAYPKYESQLERFCTLMDPLLDSSPPESLQGISSLQDRLKNKVHNSVFWTRLLHQAASMGQKDMVDFMDLLLSPASKVLNNWFQTDVLKATLATDAVIGSTASVNTPGSGYVLLHHVMGETDGDRGIWSYVEGGMGSVSMAIGNAAREAGAHIVTSAGVSQLIVDDSGKANGVLLADGTVVQSSNILSNVTPYKTFMELVPCLPTLTSFHINMVVPTKKAMNQRLVSWTLIVGLFVISCVAELERFEHAGKPDGSLSFLVVGDWGRRGHYNQSQVAFQMGTIGEQLDIDFIISTGDNFYDNGLTGVDDPLFHQSFTDIYTTPSLKKQWYNVLGNHDYRGNAEAQLSPILTKMDSRWLCLRSFVLNAGPEIAEFFFVDTTPFVTKYFTDPEDHVYDWKTILPREKYLNNLLMEVESALGESRAKWKIVVGHHAIKSAGHHGNTKELNIHLLPLLQTYDVDLYINGHDHCLQHISSSDSGTQFMTSGGGSKAWRGDVSWWNPHELKFYHDGQGFMSVEMTPTEVSIKFYDVFGNVLHNWSSSKQLSFAI